MSPFSPSGPSSRARSRAALGIERAAGLQDADPFAAFVDELRCLGDEALMRTWHGVRERLDEGATDFGKGHQLRLRHYACRKVAAERFGATGHVERYRAMFGG